MEDKIKNDRPETRGGLNNPTGIKNKPKVGQPPIIKSVEEMEQKIEAYFNDCDGKLLLDKDNNPVLDKNGNPIIYDRKPYTITGLALAIGFNSRVSLLQYQNKNEYFDSITKAKARVEQYAESRLYDREGQNGAKFALACTFGVWREKIDIATTNINMSVDSAELSEEKRTELIAELLRKRTVSEEDSE